MACLMLATFVAGPFSALQAKANLSPRELLLGEKYEGLNSAAAITATVSNSGPYQRASFYLPFVSKRLDTKSDNQACPALAADLPISSYNPGKQRFRCKTAKDHSRPL